MTELELKLQEMAAKDWQQFKAIIGEDAVLHAKVCLYRQAERSYNEIVIKLGVTFAQARRHCYKCKVSKGQLI